MAKKHVKKTGGKTYKKKATAHKVAVRIGGRVAKVKKGYKVHRK